MKKLNVAVVGLGWVAEAHIIAFNATQNAQVTTVCSTRNPSPEEVSARYGCPLKVYSSLEQVLADPSIDVVSICTANMLHPQQTIDCLNAGKHVYIEKPVALNFEDMKKIREAVVAHPRQKVCVGFELRYCKQVQMLSSIIEQGLIGEVHYGETDYYHGIGPWYGQFRWSKKADGGGSALLSGGCHAMDALLRLMGEPVEEVMQYSTKSRAECYAEYEFDPCSVTILKFADGRLGKVAACIDSLQPYYFHCHLVGSKGSLLDNKLSTKVIDGLRPEKWTTMETILADSGDVLDHPYLPQVEAFVQSILNDKPMPLTGFADAFETHRVIFAADMSAKLGRPVKLRELV
jgi:predicted dehydrogenase